MDILLVKMGPIGDAVMAMPVVEAIHREHPGSSLTWLTTEGLRALVGRVLPAQDIMTVADRPFWNGGIAGRLKVLSDLWRRLAGRRFDLVLIAHANPRFRLLIPPWSAGEVRSFRILCRRPLPLPGRRHHHEHVRLLSGSDDDRPVDAHFPTVDLRPPVRPIPSGAVALCPGGARNPLREDRLRRWPVASYAAVAEALVATGRPVVLIGGPDDAWVRPSFAGLDVIDLIGGCTLDQTVDVLAACSAAVAHDSGPMHLADLAGVPTVAIFGPTMPAEKAPLRTHHRVLWGGAGLTCRPCYDGIDYAACPAPRCMESVAPASVVAALEEMLATGVAHG